ncbi:MAG: hypothetical protein ACPG66_09940 [Flavobacteriales bacterium]
MSKREVSSEDNDLDTPLASPLAAGSSGPIRKGKPPSRGGNTLARRGSGSLARRGSGSRKPYHRATPRARPPLDAERKENRLQRLGQLHHNCSCAFPTTMQLSARALDMAHDHPLANIASLASKPNLLHHVSCGPNANFLSPANVKGTEKTLPPGLHGPTMEKIIKHAKADLHFASMLLVRNVSGSSVCETFRAHKRASQDLTNMHAATQEFNDVSGDERLRDLIMKQTTLVNRLNVTFHKKIKSCFEDCDAAFDAAIESSCEIRVFEGTDSLVSHFDMLRKSGLVATRDFPSNARSNAPYVYMAQHGRHRRIVVVPRTATEAHFQL